MPLIGPIIPKFSNVSGEIPKVVSGPTGYSPGGTGNFLYPSFFNELICNGKDGRVWIRKSAPDPDEIQRGSDVFYRYNYEQVGGPYVITEKTGGHTLMAEDSARILEMNVSASTQVTVPSYTGSNAVSFVKGTEIKILLTNTGPVNITGASGVTLNSKNGFNLTSQWGMATLIKRDVNSWVVTGDLS